MIKILYDVGAGSFDLWMQGKLTMKTNHFQSKATLNQYNNPNPNTKSIQYCHKFSEFTIW